MISQQKLWKQASLVIEMNKIRDNITHHNKELILAQTKFIQDEVDETLYDGIKDDNCVEFVDGLGDVFVTIVFQEYLLADNDEEFKNIFEQAYLEAMQHPIHEEDLVVFLNGIRSGSVYENFKKGKLFYNLFCILHVVDRITQDEFEKLKKEHLESTLQDKSTLMDFVIDEVNNSNMSKFPYEHEKTKEDILIDLAHVKRKVKHNNISYVIKNGRIVYWDLDIMKFQKPTTFKEPDLSIVEKFDSLKQYVNILSQQIK